MEPNIEPNIEPQNNRIQDSRKKELSAADWMNRIRRSLKYRDQVRDKQGWQRFLDYYEGDYRVNGKNIQSPPINIVFGYVQTATARIYFRDPHITVNPTKVISPNGARILEEVINYWFRELNAKSENERVLLDTYLVAHGWIKYGYKADMGQNSDTSGEPSEFIKNEEIFMSYVPWDDIVFDITLCKDPPYDCRWIAHRIIKPLEEIKGNQEFHNTELLSSNVSMRDAKGEKLDETMKDSDLDLFEYWEIWDKDTNTIVCVADGSEQYLQQKQNTYEMEGLPFSMMKFNRINGKAYPLSDIGIIESQILERIKLRGGQINHIKRWARQLSIEKGSMSKQEIAKFSEGIDGAVTEREKGSAPPQPIAYADLQRESFMLDDLIQRDMDAAIGQTDVERGGVARTKTDTLGELKEQTAGTTSRSAKRQDILEDFLEEEARKLISLIQQFQTTPKYVRITGMKPDEIKSAFQGLQSDENGFYFTKDDIQGKYDVEVKAGSTLPMNRENRIKVMEALLNPAVAQAIGIIQGPVPPTAVGLEIGKELIRELDLKGVEKAYDQQISALNTPLMPQNLATAGISPSLSSMEGNTLPQPPPILNNQILT